MAGATGTTVTFPLDFVKTQFQVGIYTSLVANTYITMHTRCKDSSYSYHIYLIIK